MTTSTTVAPACSELSINSDSAASKLRYPESRVASRNRLGSTTLRCIRSPPASHGIVGLRRQHPSSTVTLLQQSTLLSLLFATIIPPQNIFRNQGEVDGAFTRENGGSNMAPWAQA